MTTNKGNIVSMTDADVAVLDLELELAAARAWAQLWKTRAKSWRRTAMELEQQLPQRNK